MIRFASQVPMALTLDGLEQVGRLVGAFLRGVDSTRKPRREYVIVQGGQPRD